MTIAQKQNVPRLPVNYSSEILKINELALKITALTTTGDASWVSPSSTVAYSAPVGGEAQLLSVLNTAMSGYLINASDWNSIQAEIDKLFGMDVYMPGYYQLTEFDVPLSGNITTTIKKTSDNSVYATQTTVFDTPLAGNIQETTVCSARGLNVVATTVFDSPSVGNIKTTYV